MKKLISIIALVAALLIVNSTQAQTTDSTKIEQIEERMDKYSSQNTTGNGFVSTGVIISGIGAGVISKEQNVANVGVPLVVGGAIITGIGSIINMCSHRKLRSKKYKQRFE